MRTRGLVAKIRSAPGGGGKTRGTAASEALAGQGGVGSVYAHVPLGAQPRPWLSAGAGMTPPQRRSPSPAIVRAKEGAATAPGGGHNAAC